MYGEDLDSPITVKDLEKLDLLERCIKESLRMFPVTAAIGRTNTKEIEISKKISHILKNNNKNMLFFFRWVQISARNLFLRHDI